MHRMLLTFRPHTYRTTERSVTCSPSVYIFNLLLIWTLWTWLSEKYQLNIKLQEVFASYQIESFFSLKGSLSLLSMYTLNLSCHISFNWFFCHVGVCGGKLIKEALSWSTAVALLTQLTFMFSSLLRNGGAIDLSLSFSNITLHDLF